MAQLPDVQSGGSQPVPQPSGGVASYEPPNWRQVGMAGQIISGAGRELQEAASTVAATNERQDALVAQSAANTLQQQRISQEFDPKTGFRNAKEANALGQPFIDKYTQTFNNSQSQIRDALLNDNQRRIFDQHAQVQGLQFQSALLQHQAEETEKFNNATANSTIDLNLRSMAQKPNDELNFQTSLAAINATIDESAKRRGLPPEAVKNLKGTYLDAAYGSRITSILQGIPGVAQADPYSAEKMFKQVQDQLGPAAQTHLAEVVQKGVMDVQADAQAKQSVFGTPPVKPSTLGAVAIGTPLEGIVRSLETNGNPNAVSPKGATGLMQVMPETAANPGYGVLPAQVGPDGKVSQAEMIRVGQDYLGAMSARYSEPALVLAAYNSGPGAVDKWIQQYGDPRAGQIPIADWVSKIPYDETKGYVANGLKMLGADTGDLPKAPPPTPAQLKTQLASRVEYARQVAEQQYPNNPDYSRRVAALAENYGRVAISNAEATQQAAHDSLIQGAIGSKPDSSDAPKTITALLSNPDMQRAWDQSSPEVKDALQKRFARGDSKWDADSMALYYKQLGMAGSAPDQFVAPDNDLTKLYGSIPDSNLVELMRLQRSLDTKDVQALAAGKQLTQAHALVEPMLKPVLAGMPTASPTQKAAQAQTRLDFTGRLDELINSYHDTNQKWPEAADVKKMASGLLVQGTQTGTGWFGTSIGEKSGRAFQLPQKDFVVPLPPAKSADYAKAVDLYTKTMKSAPTDPVAFQRWYTAYKQNGGS